MKNFTLTLKIQAEASECMRADFTARADKAAKRLGMHDRAWHDYRKPEAVAARAVKVRNLAAVAIGESYHAHCGSLYTSQYAGVRYGAGGAENVEWDRYAKSCKWPCKYRDAGARIDGQMLIIENARGRVATQLKMPRASKNLLTKHDGLTHGDLYGIQRTPSLIDRYNASGSLCGVAVLLPYSASGGSYWEHGATAAACVAENARKIEHAAALAKAATETAKEARRLRLLARLSTQVMVSRDDAHAATGACTAGIDGWCARMGVTASALPAREVVALAARSGERRALAAALYACRRALSVPA